MLATWTGKAISGWLPQCNLYLNLDTYIDTYILVTEIENQPDLSTDSTQVTDVNLMRSVAAPSIAYGSVGFLKKGRPISNRTVQFQKEFIVQTEIESALISRA